MSFSRNKLFDRFQARTIQSIANAYPEELASEVGEWSSIKNRRIWALILLIISGFMGKTLNTDRLRENGQEIPFGQREGEVVASIGTIVSFLYGCYSLLFNRNLGKYQDMLKPIENILKVRPVVTKDSGSPGEFLAIDVDSITLQPGEQFSETLLVHTNKIPVSHSF